MTSSAPAIACLLQNILRLFGYKPKMCAKLCQAYPAQLIALRLGPASQPFGTQQHPALCVCAIYIFTGFVFLS